MAEKTGAAHIKGLRALCDQLEALRKQADEICKAANAEICRARMAGQRDRRVKSKKVKRDRRRFQSVR